MVMTGVEAGFVGRRGRRVGRRERKPQSDSIEVPVIIETYQDPRRCVSLLNRTLTLV